MQVKRMIMPIVAGVFVLAAGTFGTLWLLERSDHRKAADELTSLRAEADGVRAQVAEAEKKRAEWDKKIMDVSNARLAAESVAYSSRRCVDAAREWLKLPAGNSAQLDKKIVEVGAFCRRD